MPRSRKDKTPNVENPPVESAAIRSAGLRGADAAMRDDEDPPREEEILAAGTGFVAGTEAEPDADAAED